MFYLPCFAPSDYLEGDYLATKPMMAHVSVEEARKEESNIMGLPKLIKKELERIYT